MTALVFATGFETPTPRYEPWTSSQHVWRVGEETWDLSNGDRGAVLLAGVRGMNMPPIQRYSQKSAAVPGSRWRGSITDEREVFWPVDVFGGGNSTDWRDIDAAFWESMNPDRTGVWTVTSPAGVSRSLTLRYSDCPDEDDISPELLGWKTYGITLIAEQPYWVGERITRSWDKGGEQIGFFGPEGAGPPFYIAPSATLDTATFSNPGDVEARPVWTIFGPTTSVVVGLNGKTIQIPFTIADGQWLRIDTNNTDQRAMLGTGDVLPDKGTDRTSSLGQVAFGDIPAGGEVPLSLSMTGTGKVQVDLDPLYYRAR